jgi:hypothetical protein
MDRPADRVVSSWRSTGVVVNAPASARALASFESQMSVRVPLGLGELLLLANGFEGASKDANGFRFLSLDEYDTAIEDWLGPHERFSKTAWAFADYLDWSWAYAVEMGSQHNGSVYVIGTSDGVASLISRTFDEFLALYLANDSRLYP